MAQASVELRLQLDKLKGDIDRANAMLQTQLSKNFGGGGSGGLATSPSQTIRDLAGGGSPRPSAPSGIGQNPRLTAQDLKNLSFSIAPLLKPGGALSTAFSARQIFSFFQGAKGEELISGLGLSSLKGAALATTAVVGALTAVGFSLKGLEAVIKKTIEGVVDALGTARHIYALSLIGPGSTGFYARQQAISSVLGIDPKYAFATNASRGVDQRSSFATSIIGGNAKELAGVAVSFKILAVNIGALFSALAKVSASDLQSIAESLSAMFKALIVSGTPQVLAKITSELLKFIVTLSEFGAAFGIFIKGIYDAIVGGLHGKNPSKILDAAITNALSIFKTPKPNDLPTSGGILRQLPASSLERMGLVVGGGITNKLVDYSRRTAVATEHIAQYVQKSFQAPTTAVNPLAATP